MQTIRLSPRPSDKLWVWGQSGLSLVSNSDACWSWKAQFQQSACFSIPFTIINVFIHFMLLLIQKTSTECPLCAMSYVYGHCYCEWAFLSLTFFKDCLQIYKKSDERWLLKICPSQDWPEVHQGHQQKLRLSRICLKVFSSLTENSEI
jgi:hypothetical protein